MKFRSAIWRSLVVLLTLVCASRPAMAQTRDELRQRFEHRYERILQLKDDAIIGETWLGDVEAIDERLLSDDARSLIKDENADRKALYRLIADEVDRGEKRVPPRIVAERNARRAFGRAEPDHFLKISESRWIVKREQDRAETIARLKKEGVVGETYAGYLEAIATRPADDVAKVVEAENRARQKMYVSLARRIDGASADEIADKAARKAREHLPPGQYFKERDGSWDRRPDRQR